MKDFEALWEEISTINATRPASSGTAQLFEKGVHAIGKKIMEEAGEVWIAAEYQSDEELALELSQLIYYIQVIAQARGISLDSIYKEL